MRLRVGRTWVLVLMLGVFGAGGPAIADEPEASFYDGIRSAFPKYNQLRTIRALAVCIDFHRSTLSSARVPAGYWYYKESGPLFTTTLVREALNYCVQEKRRQSLRDCDCVIVARNNRFRLEATPEQLAKLATPRAATLPLVRRPQSEASADHTPIADPETYTGMLIFGGGANREWVWASLTVTPTRDGAEFEGTVGDDQCRGDLITEDRKNGTWGGHCEGRGSLWGTVKLEEGRIVVQGVEADGGELSAQLTRQ
ncbi:hypothetical protein [Algihabitans sp.]|uniref:hypothetical protein n=1 Tax=Algihabitans sp. TaxID=2821514 RepID=UPI003BA9DA59